MLTQRTRTFIGGVLLIVSACLIALALISSRGIAAWGLGARPATLLHGCLALVAGWAGIRFRRPVPSVGFRTGHIVLFEAPEWHYAGRRTPPVTIRGARDAIERFIPRAEFGTLFDRVAVWRSSPRPVAELPGEALGVWGRRKCRRLRRILRERGASVEVRREIGPPQTVARWYRAWGR